MPFPGPKSQWKHAAFLILSFLIFIILLLNATRLRSASIYPIEGRNEGLTTQNVTDHAHVDAAIALGSESSKDPLSLLQELEGKNRFLKKRAPTLSYESALCKGRNALQVIHQGNPNPPKFTQQDLEDGGWLTDEDFPRVIPDDLKTAVSELKISSNSDDIHRISVSQFLEFTTQNGKRNDDPSGGTYLQTYIPKSGTIFASQNISPLQNIADHRRKNNQPPLSQAELRDHIPKLNRWSDVVWLLWVKQAGDQAGNLRYIFRDNVINDDSKGVIDQIFRIPPNTLDKPWPGITFDLSRSDKEGEQGTALLGTPHGTGIAWMLADHKAELGERHIKITVFTSHDSSQSDYYMLFELIRA